MVEKLVLYFNSLPPELLWVGMILLSYGSLLLLLRFFGEAGLYVYISVSLIGANIQVLKAVKFGLFPEPIALGTEWFCSLYLAADILTERQGPAAAKKAIYLSFATYLFFTLAMLLTIGFQPLAAPPGEESLFIFTSHQHISALFSPMPQIFAAGMISYITSSLCNVWIFQRIRKKTGARLLWLRNIVASVSSAILDSTVFSLLAWIVFAPDPLPLHTVIVTYIGGSLLLRTAVSVLDTPVIYLAKKL